VKAHNFRRRSSSVTAEKRLISSLPSKHEDRLQTLTTSYRLMALETGLVLFVIMAYLVLTCWTGWWTADIISSPNLIMVSSLLDAVYLG
jgi:hypothetical protein